MRIFLITLTTVLVVAAASVPLLIWQAKAATPAPLPPEEAKALTEEQHYYVFLTVVEVAPTKADGRGWDAGGGAPDLVYTIRWQGQEVFRSSTKDDTLVAKWTNLSLDLEDVVGTVSLDDSIKAARITARKGEVVEFAVYDKDVTSADDLVGAWTVAVDRLRRGDERWDRPGGQVVAATCRVLPLDKVEFATLTR